MKRLIKVLILIIVPVIMVCFYIGRLNDASLYFEPPEYAGQPYTEIAGNIPDFSDDEKKSDRAFEYYSGLDSLGRCGQAFANICPELMPQEERGPIGDIRPSGWHTVKYPDIIEDNYLYNRCHLIAYMLAGENANEKNLITGTRYLNVTGMLPFEIRVANYVE
ncbi:MAG: DNA/RNA non-specific endonuclease, partial [Lachnospiraceae bacterium]|nr:DNA/RNA non-specific endonuclease [Lachnospiraceae bacterium]